MADKKRLKRNLKARDGHRMFIHSHMKAATELLNDPEPAKVKLKLVRITLENKVSTLKTLEEQIFTLLPEEKIEEDVIESDQVASRTRECIVQITSHLSKVNEEEATTAFYNEQSANSAKKVRLPKECWDKPRDMRSAPSMLSKFLEELRILIACKVPEGNFGTWANY